MTRTARLRFALAAALLLGAAWIWLARTPADIKAEEARAIAAELKEAYLRDSGDIPAHFAAPVMVGYPDGWEFTYGYRPCPGEGELRIFVSLEGRGSYALTPECNPVRGFAVKPRTV